MGFVGDIVSSKISADAQKDIADQQVKAINQARQFMYEQLDPTKLSPLTLNADTENAKNRLALQKQIDPALYATRYETEDRIRKMAADAGKTPAEVSDQAVKEALDGSDTAKQGKQQLIDAALEQLHAGASLPPDVQAELVKAGLEKSGMVTGAASGKGFGGQNIRKLIGSEAVNLQMRRQQQASGLLGQAQGLESSRAQVLGQLFPSLAATQMNQLSTQGNVLNQSNSIMPNAGLSGNDVANLWLARVGASTSLSRDAADAQARGGFGAAAAWQQGIGGATNYAANATKDWQSWGNNSTMNNGQAKGWEGSTQQNDDSSWG